jgi:hypothetical protein
VPETQLPPILPSSRQTLAPVVRLRAAGDSAATTMLTRLIVLDIEISVFVC